MIRINKLLIGLVAGVVFFVVAVLILINISLTQTCVNTILQTSKNSSDEFVAVLFERNCGATTGFSTQVSIIKAGQELTNASGNTYVADGYPTYNKLTWLDAQTLHIGGADYKATKRIEKFMDIKITY